MSFPLTKRSFLAAFSASVVWMQTSFAGAAIAGFDPAAESFIDDLAQRAVSILDDKTMTMQERERAFSDLVLANTDVDAIGNFALGPYRRTAKPQEMAEYHDLFRQYSEMFYSTRLSRYSGERLFITGSQAVKRPDEVVVTSELRLEDAPAPLPLNWRLVKRDGRYIIIDLQALGAWLSLEQRSLFYTIISNNGGRLSALNSKLRQKVANGEGPELPGGDDN
jgi:phospholipid transport system substrate-binding protein